ncbi:MAG: D-alanyl-D-alanine endopeptidase [Betaproteobacteria bacterium]|jgi:D-alanyl-D-alanine endopeptidase (penicillin-binding protein 7)|nr:D-alanyl-D-alanine endopeptidase [Betaproteobacteria bacterium]MDH5286992.1 D-alanyl-D-alanine endopeptidase [Betaproteobacteria bacterium]
MIKRFLALVFACVAGIAAAAQDPDPAKLQLASANALVRDAVTGQPIYAKAADEVTAIASLTKLMTAMVALDAGQPLDELISVGIDDFDYLKGTRSRLGLGTQLPRREMLRLALMSSENRAASAVARHYPGGLPAFVAAMNAKAVSLGLARTRFADPTGLSPRNVSTANDLATMVTAAAQYPLIREYSTTPSAFVEVDSTGRIVGFNNSNRLVASGSWEILLQKTGYIREAGRCLVMLANVASKPVVIVLLDSVGKFTRLGDAERVKHWLETGSALPLKAAIRAAVPRGATSAPARSAAAPVRGSFKSTASRSR